MITVTAFLPRAHEESSRSEDLQFQKELVELVRSRANRKQLGDRFVRIGRIVEAGGDDEPAGIDFEFTGDNSHGAQHTVEPFIRDLAAELRAKLGYRPMLVSKVNWEA